MSKKKHINLPAFRLHFVTLAWGGVIATELLGMVLFTASQENLFIVRLTELLWLMGLILFYKQTATIGFTTPSRNHWVLMGIVAAASCAVAAITYWLGVLDEWTALPASIHGAIGIALMLTLAPAVEEILFRGLLYRMLDEIAGRYPAIVISSVCFSLAHGMLFSPQLVGGLLFAWVYARTGNLWLPILLHIGANGALVLMAR